MSEPLTTDESKTTMDEGNEANWRTVIAEKLSGFDLFVIGRNLFREIDFLRSALAAAEADRERLVEAVQRVLAEWPFYETPDAHIGGMEVLHLALDAAPASEKEEG